MGRETSYEVGGKVPGRPRLVLLRGELRGKEYQIEPGNNLVGRWAPDEGAFPEIDLEEADPEAKISRKHAIIECSAREVSIEDAGSLNGTYINQGPRLQPGCKHVLRSGDELILGKTFLRFEVDEES